MSEENTPKLIYVGFNDGTSVFSKSVEKSQGREIWCSACDKCELYKKKQCICRIYNLFSWCTCKFGRMKTYEGPTKRAKAFHNFKCRFVEQPLYADKLDQPVNQKLFKVNGYVAIKLLYVGYNEEGNNLTDPTFASGDWIFMKEEQFTNDFIYHVCTFKPQAMLGGEIKSYQKEVVPEFISQLKMYMTDIYNNFISEYPEYKIEDVNYVGKKAYLSTLKPGCTVKGFVFDGEYLYNPDYHISFFFLNTNVEVKVKVTDDMTIEITDNSQVDENTKFV